ncbi:MAG: hypothetical protein ACLTA9_05215 [Clostridium saudiense]|jgi:hypothetical protein|uniref:hypothetical protein n=1 Tax=Clostridia TaxID=186801 RepID=UPI0006C11AA6|nr:MULTISPECIES: hypothetical protein [Clostridium]MDU2292024.1 hypothetical protein [Clostridium celatum]MBX9184924.1 hypothetical protein [Clostridium sp. K04]MDU4325328.1 hypothetical protein [Clostridium celatum]MEE0725403.1 hypothetical protein [Clostridium saudiense]CUO22272.1 Uncharacterised protein [Clostridium disporicum]
MKQDLVIVVSKYKLWICIIYVMLLSIIFPLAYADEIGGVIDPYSSLLSILFFSDLFYLEILEKRYEVIKLKSKDVLIGIVKRRFFIAWLFVELLALVQYSLYLMKVNNNIGKMDNLSMIIITLIATGVSIAFFGYLTVVLVNITKKIGIGVGIAVLIWFLLNSTIGMNIFKSANIFAFCEFFTNDLDYSWVIGKLIGAIIVLFGMTVFKSSLIYYKNEVKRYDN